MKIVKTTTFKGSWLDRKGILTTHHLNTNVYGPRIQVWAWADGTYRVEAVQGDGRKANFKRLRQEDLRTDLETAPTRAAMLVEQFVAEAY